MNPKLVFRFGSNYHLDHIGVGGGFEIPVADVRAIYQQDKALIVETIDGKHMIVTTREIQIGEVWDRKP